MISGVGLAALAGVLSILSPCVLPLVPIVLGTAASEHPLGPAVLAGGLALSFTAIGVFVATIGFALGLDTEVFRLVAALLLLAIGALLIVPRLQAGFALAAAPLGRRAEERFGGVARAGLGGQFAVGLLLGAVWSPCVGPTLGAASLLAARGDNLLTVSATMLAFGLGAALPLLFVGQISRRTFMLWRGRLLSTGKGLRQVTGAALVLAGLLVLSGLDKRVETSLVAASPDWLTAVTTRF